MGAAQHSKNPTGPEYGISGADLGYLCSYFVEVCVLKACREGKGQDSP